jgi:hypothetical protein
MRLDCERLLAQRSEEKARNWDEASPRPGDRHALARTAEEGRNLLGPLVRRVKRPGPRHGEVVISLGSSARE